MANITSISMEVKPPAGCGVLIVLLGLLGFAIGWSKTLKSPETGVGILIGSLVVLAIGIFLAASMRSEYISRIQSSSGEIDALVSKNKDYIQKILDAMNRAVIERG